jgi:hypothetical protein
MLETRSFRVEALAIAETLQSVKLSMESHTTQDSTLKTSFPTFFKASVYFMKTEATKTRIFNHSSQM